jgi:two-component system sensor histidine kinase MtrB
MTGSLAVIVLLVVGALVVLTSRLQSATTMLAANVESVYLLEETDIDLLLHSRTVDPGQRHDIERGLRDRLVIARRDVSATERQPLEEATARVEAYVAAANDPTRKKTELDSMQAAAHAAVDSVVTLSVDLSRAEYAKTARWDEIADMLGLGLGALLIAVTAIVLVWLQRRAFRPVFTLANAMVRFGRGDREARAEEAGPTELREMSARFNEMANALDAQRQSRIAYLGGVAHDLRGPLAVLQMSIDTLGQAGPEERGRAAAIATRQISRLDRMAGDFLEMAKIEAGVLDLQLRSEDLRALIEQVVDLQGDSASHPRLVLRLTSQPVYVNCDALRIEQVITNLISNALKYSPAPEPVDIELTVDRGSAVVCVTDRGSGLSAEDQAQLFEPFRRVGASRHAVPGIGLGLFVVRRIVVAHGGRIDVVSEPGHGSRFTVALPVAQPPSTQTGQPTAASP